MADGNHGTISSAARVNYNTPRLRARLTVSNGDSIQDSAA